LILLLADLRQAPGIQALAYRSNDYGHPEARGAPGLYVTIDAMGCHDSVAQDIGRRRTGYSPIGYVSFADRSLYARRSDSLLADRLVFTVVLLTIIRAAMPSADSSRGIRVQNNTIGMHMRPLLWQLDTRHKEATYPQAHSSSTMGQPISRDKSS
jgi:hypothetical protein